MANTLSVRRRIRSIKSTRQITKAMELVAATKMRRAQIQALKTRTYALLAWDMIRNLARKVDVKLHAMLRQPKVTRRQAVVLLTSNRGLAGSFNAQIITKTLEYVRSARDVSPDMATDLIVMGKKGADSMFKARQNIVADFKKIDVNLQIADILPLASMLTEKFSLGEYDRVTLAYTDFVSTLAQRPRIKQLLPFPKLSLATKLAVGDALGQVGGEGASEQPILALDYSFGYLFEPTPDTVLARLIPRLIEMQIYQAVLESNASEHSARMVAMKNASDAAADIITDLTLEFNQMRQAAITKEIAEISAGRLAVT